MRRVARPPLRVPVSRIGAVRIVRRHVAFAFRFCAIDIASASRFINASAAPNAQMVLRFSTPKLSPCLRLFPLLLQGLYFCIANEADAIILRHRDAPGDDIVRREITLLERTDDDL